MPCFQPRRALEPKFLVTYTWCGRRCRRMSLNYVSECLITLCEGKSICARKASIVVASERVGRAGSEVTVASASICRPVAINRR
jgi:hypothetical protein